MGRIIYIVNRPSAENFKIPLFWATAKTYYEENSKYANEWSWADPNLDYSDAYALAKTIADHQPTVVGFSVYIWNEKFSLTLAKKLKELSPTTYVIWGGPQCDIHYNENFFQTHPYIDLVVPSDAYGERSISDILNNISENNQLIPTDIQYSYYPGTNRVRQFNSLSPNKREYKWPNNPYRAQHQYLIPFIKQNNDQHQQRFWLTIETSRGCPYKCSFCDWGGGTYTKTVKKDFSIVLDELTWAGENQIDAVSFTDANFGLFPIDIEYIKHVVSTKQKYGFPKQVLIQPTKTKIDQLTKIYKLLGENEMLSHYQIAIQDLNDEVKKNVDRIDFKFEDQVAMFKELQKVKDLPIWIESILGLPGSSIDTVKEGIQRISLEKLQYPLSHHWAMLPATPAAAPAYREKFKLVTVKGKSSNGVGATKLIKAKPGREHDPGLAIASNFDETTGEYVVGTFSYTTDDWIAMNILQIFTASMQNSGILTLIADYIWETHQIPYGEFFNKCVSTILTNPIVDKQLQTDYLKLKQKFDEWLITDSSELYVDYHPDFDFDIAPSVYLLFVSLLDLDVFFDAVKITLSDLVTVDDVLNDLCYYSKNRIIDINYIPGKKFTCEYNWSKYITNNQLIKQQITYELEDTRILAGGRWFDIDWHSQQGLLKEKQYFYRVCFDFRSSKISKKFKEY